MADYTKVNGVAAADIVKIDGVAIANIAKCDGTTKPSSAAVASRWVVATGGGYIAHAANSDRTSWTSYDGTLNSRPKALALAFGRNANGDGIYVCTRDAASREIQVSSTDVTTNANWTDINISPNDDQHDVAWGAKAGATAGVWMSVGDDGLIMRSTDGAANWSAVDMSSTNLGQ